MTQKGRLLCILCHKFSPLSLFHAAIEKADVNTAKQVRQNHTVLLKLKCQFKKVFLHNCLMVDFGELAWWNILMTFPLKGTFVTVDLTDFYQSFQGVWTMEHIYNILIFLNLAVTRTNQVQLYFYWELSYSWLSQSCGWWFSKRNPCDNWGNSFFIKFQISFSEMFH